MEVHLLLSTTPNVPPHMAQDQAWKDNAASVLRKVYADHRPATLEDAYRAWRDDPQTTAFAEAVRAHHLRDYRDDAADPVQVEPTAELSAALAEPPRWVPASDTPGDTECYTRRFAGQRAFLQRDVGDQWRLIYLGYRSKPFDTRETAERDAPSFTLEVLDTLAQQIER